MKKNKVCPKCDSIRIGHFDMVPDTGHTTGAVPATAGQIENGFWSAIVQDSRFTPVGKLEAYLCGDCGFYEHYVSDPGELPYDKLKGFRWVHSDKAEGQGPYR